MIFSWRSYILRRNFSQNDFMKKIFTFFLLLCGIAGFSQSTTVVISQVYGGGGANSGSPTYKNDYVELHNISSTSQSIGGFSLQYGSATGNFGSTASNIYVFPGGTSIPAGGFLLVQLSASGTAGADFPVAADLTTTNLTMSGTNGKVVLSNQAAALACGATATTCTLPAGNIVDLVAYGAANNAEGGVSVNNGSSLTNVQAAVRKTYGCQDTDNNNNDFEVVSNPVPRNSATNPISCGPAGPALLVTGTINNFGNVFVGANSASQSYTISGINLTGAPGNVTVTAPADFEVSANNSSWSSSLLIPYSSATLSATTVYVRFSPQSVGVKTGNVTNAVTGATTVNVAVSGTGAVVPSAPLITATTLAGFGNVCVNTIAGPNSFTINGTNLAAGNITVSPLAGYEYATTAAGTYSPSLSIAQTGGTFSQQVFVRFTPTAIQSFNGNIDIAGGNAPLISVAATGAGTNGVPSLNTSAASSVTLTTAALTGTITNTGCSVITSYGFEYSTINGFVNGTVIPASNLTGGVFTANALGLTPATTYYFRAFAVNSGGKGLGAQQTFTTATPVLAATPLSGFGTSCLNVVSTANSFTITSAGLSNANVTVGPLAGFTFATTQNGTYSSTLTIPQPGGAFTQIVFVKFTPVASQSYNGNIPVSGGGANTLLVPVAAVGFNATPTVTTGSASNIQSNAVTLFGTISDIGCSNVTSYGIEYSGINGFANGNGTRQAGSNLAGTSFSANLTGLVQGATYYYKAYAINAGGVSYGTQQTFTTTAIPNGLTLYASPINRGGTLRFTLKDIQPGHYGANIYNVTGQKVYRKDMILQVNFIDDKIVLPSNIGTGVYTLEIEKPGYRIYKTFMIQ
ncbi:MAG: hypothetical protein EOP51_14175 [Sphingobacteriales bacterium]|nr:MAG: hypothetical protein EOP51_14175 [Sphingobacteriales bacterium]